MQLSIKLRHATAIKCDRASEELSSLLDAATRRRGVKWAVIPKVTLRNWWATFNAAIATNKTVPIKASEI